MSTSALNVFIFTIQSIRASRPASRPTRRTSAWQLC